MIGGSSKFLYLSGLGSLQQIGKGIVNQPFNDLSAYLNSIVIERPTYIIPSILSVGAHYANLIQQHKPFYNVNNVVLNLRLNVVKVGTSFSGKSLTDEAWAGGTRIKHGLFEGLDVKFVVESTCTEAGLFGSIEEVIEYDSKAKRYVKRKEIVNGDIQICSNGFVVYDEIRNVLNAAKTTHSNTLYTNLLIYLASGRYKKKLRTGGIEYVSHATFWGNTQWRHIFGLDLASGLGSRVIFGCKNVSVGEKKKFALENSPFSNQQMKIDTNLYDVAKGRVKDLIENYRAVLLGKKSIDHIEVDSIDRYNYLRSMGIDYGLEPEQIDKILIGYSIWLWDDGPVFKIIAGNRQISDIVEMICKQYQAVVSMQGLNILLDAMEYGKKYKKSELYQKIKTSKLSWQEMCAMLQMACENELIESEMAIPKGGGNEYYYYWRIV